LLGKIFSYQVLALTEILGDMAWVIIGLFVSLALGWTLWTYLRPKKHVGRGA
jgi:hypothetical protein